MALVSLLAPRHDTNDFEITAARRCRSAIIIMLYFERKFVTLCVFVKLWIGPTPGFQQLGELRDRPGKPRVSKLEVGISTRRF